MSDNRSPATFERLQLAKETTDLGIWEWNVDDDQLIWDKRTAEMFGFTHENGVEEFLKMVHPEDREVVRQELRQAVDKEEPLELQYRIQTDGDTRWIEVHGKWVDEDSSQKRLIGSVQDITEEKKRGEELRLKSQAMDDSPIGILLTDALQEDNPICYVNEGFVRLTGYDRDEILGRNCRFLQGEDTDPDVVKQIREAIDAEEPVEVDLRNYRADGEMFWNHLIITPIRNQDGEVTHFIGYQQDVSDRKELEESLRNRERMYRTLFDEANVGFLIESLDDIVLEVNQKTCELLGFRKEELEGMSLEQITPSDIKKECGDEGIVGYYLNKHGTSPFHWEYVHKDSTRVPVEKSKTPITYEGTEGVLVCIRDRTELERIRKRDERKSSFVSQVTHDLRTPLNSITGIGTLLKDTDLSGEQQNYLQTILNAARNMERLTNDILDLNRVERGEIILDEESFHLQRLLGELISLYSQQASEQNLMISSQVDEEVPDRLVGDPDRLKRILHNLVDNAINHTREGSIQIEVELHDRTDASVVLEFSVSDTGKGIPESKLDDIFEQHEQVETGDGGSAQGLGLGLSICKDLVELMGGEISVESEEGEGTTFTFTVELVEKEEEETTTVAMNNADALLVDDNELIRNVFRKYLEPHVSHITECETGKQALQKLEEARDGAYDVVFLDHRMDELSGIDVLETIAKHSETIDTESIYLVTGDTKEEMMEHLGSISCAGVLEKPVDESRLVQAVSSVVASQSQKAGEDELVDLQNEIQRSQPEGFHILIADDDPDTRTLLQEILSPVADELTFVTNGKEAVQQRFQLKPDLTLMDLEMPEMDGIEATELIRKREEEQDMAHVPLITQTAKAMKHVETKCLEAGADIFVRKPIKRRRLYRSILNLLS